MIKTFQKGPGVNSVFGVANRFVLKKYIQTEKAKREKLGVKLWNKCKRGLAPRVFLSFRGYSLFEMIQHSSKKSKYSKAEILCELAQYYKNFSTNFKYHKEKKRESYTDWDLYIEGVYSQYIQNRNLLISALTKSEQNIVQRVIESIISIDWKCFEKYPLHRDLHWGNILINKNGIKIIDFEHTCLGPIEFEFANSIFWDDKYSIPFTVFCAELENLDIIVNKNLAIQLVVAYFVEQIAIARDNNDEDKIRLLVKTFKTFINKYHDKLNVLREEPFFLDNEVKLQIPIFNVI